MEEVVGGSIMLRTSDVSIADVNAMEIISNGNVGIGTSTNPQEKLHVKDGNILIEQDTLCARLKVISNDPAGEAIIQLQSDNDEAT